MKHCLFSKGLHIESKLSQKKKKNAASETAVLWEALVL